MNEQDEKLLELYLKDKRKKKIFFISIVIIFIIIILFYGCYAKYKKSSNEIENSIQEKIENNVIIENNTNEENISNIENTTVKENTEEQEVNETPKEEINTVAKEDTKQETQDKTNQQSTETSGNNEKTANEKPANKDFLFTDGYTMENVTQAAQDYLKSYDFSGECIPIKDNEDVYLGMRVIFY